MLQWTLGCIYLFELWFPLTNNIGGFPFLHALSNIHCLETFWWWPFWQAQSDACVQTKFLRLCATRCYPVECSPPGSSVYGILQARILESVVMPSSRGSSQPGNWAHVSCFLHWQAGYLPLASPWNYFF